MPLSRQGQRNSAGPAADIYVGLMSGTSMDGVDAALVDFAAETPRLLAFHSAPYPAPLRRHLLQLVQGTDDELARTARLDVELGRFFAQAAVAVIDKGRVRRRAVAAHGSPGPPERHFPTIRPSQQIGDPYTIATETGITTVADFRRRDMSAGGQGAPLAPAFHEILFRVRGRKRVVLNLGGIANITLLPRSAAEAVSGFDTGPGNTLMDRWAERHLGQPMDLGGHWAAGGKVDERLLTRLLRERYFKAPPPKSTGTEYFNMRWLENQLAREHRRIAHRDVQTTLCELTARTVSDAIRKHAPDTDEVLVCGGGAHNLALMFRLQVLLDAIPVRSTEDFGIGPTCIEAMTFAWLARQTMHGRPGNLPSVTGAERGMVLGGVYTGK
jgi:anhydro-N-acetylmuramic acid kinase